LALPARGHVEAIDPDDRPNDRRLWVEKSIALYPPKLLVTMATAGNDYRPDDEAPAPKAKASRVAEMCDWLTERLADRPRKVCELRDEAEEHGFSSKTLYRARDELGLVEYRDKVLFWRLPDEAEGDTPFD
jgi:hypothetical protein